MRNKMPLYRNVSWCTARIRYDETRVTRVDTRFMNSHVTNGPQTHSSIKRAVIIAGIPLTNFRPLATDPAHDYALDPEALERAIQVRTHH